MGMEISAAYPAAAAVVLQAASFLEVVGGWFSGWFQSSFDRTQPSGAFGFHVFDVLNCILLFITLIYVINSTRVARSALNKSHSSYVRSLVDTRYDAMDRLYFELLNSRRGTRYEPGGDDPYPLMVWNFIETIVDKCERDESGELMKTWAPLISAEARNNGDWMLQEDGSGNDAHSAYFKNEFMLLARALVPIATSTLGKGEDLDFSIFLRLFRALQSSRDELGLQFRERFLEVFAAVHEDVALRLQAEMGWDLPDAIKNDDLRNNEKARRDHMEGNHARLTRAVANSVRKMARDKK
jgi:hypothetical protein